MPHAHPRPVPASRPSRTGTRLTGIDAARGTALVGMISVHVLPAWDPQTFEATVQWTLFSGRAAALFALLAGVGLAFGAGRSRPLEGRRLTAARTGLAVRAVLVCLLGLLLNQALSENPPAYNVLVHYGTFFLLAIPFLGLSARALLGCAAGFAVLGPVLVHALGPVLPPFSTYNPTFADVVTEPGATLAQLLLTGSYPALTYLVYLLAGLALGRLPLDRARTRAGLLVGGAALTAASALSSWLLLHPLGGLERLLAASPRLDRSDVRDVMVWGPDPALPASSWWWLAVTGPHTNTPLALLGGVGTGAAVLGLFLLVARAAGGLLLPLVAMGSMTLTLYSAHLLALSLELHDEQPVLWGVGHVVVAALLAVAWRRALGRGPLERFVGRAAGGARDLVLEHRLNSG